MSNNNKWWDKAKFELLSHDKCTFIRSVFFQCQHIFDTSIPTACTDGLAIKFNPDFFQKLNPKQQVGLMAHETWHVALQHPSRVGNRTPKRWNYACDYYINLMLVKLGMSLPDGALIDYKYEDMSAEEIYDLLDEEDDLPDHDQQDINPTPLTPDQAAKLDNVIQQAAIQAKDAGTGSGEMDVYLEKLRNPPISWSALLSRYVDSLSKDDINWQTRNRRFRDVYVPANKSEVFGTAVVAIDSSGSVTDEQFNKFLAATQNMKNTLNPEKLILMNFDTEVKTIHELSEGQTTEGISFTGRGGTDLNPVFQYCEDLPKKPNVLLIFSDMYAPPITHNPDYPVIFIVVDNPTAEVPFGQTVHFCTDDE